MRNLLFIGYLVLSMLLGVLPPSARADETFYLAGRELSPGFESGDTTYGVLFAGWTLDQPAWAPVALSTGGAWTATAHREGDAGFGSMVAITGGIWSVQQPDGPTLWGRVLDGSVMWPSDAAADDGCGAGVALVQAEISLGVPWGWPWERAGEMQGCLDDQEWLGDTSDPFRLPPRIWLTLTLG